MGWTDGFGLINSGIDTGKALVASIKKLTGAVDQEMRNDLNLKIGDLIDTMQRMRDEFALLRDRFADLERENAQLREFEIDRENYVLEAIGPHSTAYVRKTAGASNEAHPHLCAHCFDRKEKSILQFEKHDARTDVLKCHACGSTVHISADRGPSVLSAPGRPRAIW
ncbi:Uncharacterised protein [Starkeya nomas]|uniref:Uncharacterized protein n=1 Tax=Starkeya nomas TaxID=2666134 RepID=A0A5S9R5H1_9HYPH|nr:hypothetical protein [Starkeya nomas]CAA0128951.1 Uncharacterised protein [Starkeya nomas]